MLAGLQLSTLALGGLSWRFIEQPLRRHRARPLATRAQVFGALLRPFNHDGRPRLLILGDNIGQDFTNLFADAGLAARFSIAARRVSKQSGKVMVSEDFSLPIPPIHAAQYAAERGLDRAELQPMIAEADVIVSASDGQPFQ